MISMPHARRRADEFNSALQSGRSNDPSVQALVDVASGLRSAERVAPRPEFAASLREQLMAEADTALARQATLTLPARSTRTRERRLAAAASAFVLLGGTAGVAAAAQGSLPGDVLYPIKRGIERAQADLSTSSSGKGTYLLEQANGRLDEVRGLLDEKSADRVPGTISDFTRQAREGSALMFEAFADTSDPELIVTIRQFAAYGLATLQVLAQDAPPSAQDELVVAAETMRDIDAKAQSLCQSCASNLPALELPPMFLASADASSALQDVSKKTGTLDNSHPLSPKLLLKKVQKTADETDTTDDTSAPSGTGSADGSGGLSLPSDNTTGGGGSGDPVTDLLTQLTNTSDSLLNSDSTSTDGLLP